MPETSANLSRASIKRITAKGMEEREVAISEIVTTWVPVHQSKIPITIEAPEAFGSQTSKEKLAINYHPYSAATVILIHSAPSAGSLDVLSSHTISK